MNQVFSNSRDRRKGPADGRLVFQQGGGIFLIVGNLPRIPTGCRGAMDSAHVVSAQTSQRSHQTRGSRGWAPMYTKTPPRVASPEWDENQTGSNLIKVGAALRFAECQHSCSTDPPGTRAATASALQDLYATVLSVANGGKSEPLNQGACACQLPSPIASCVISLQRRRRRRAMKVEGLAAPGSGSARATTEHLRLLGWEQASGSMMGAVLDG